MRISDWSSDVCSSDLDEAFVQQAAGGKAGRQQYQGLAVQLDRADALARGQRMLGRHHQHQFFVEQRLELQAAGDRKSDAEGKSVSGRGDIGGRGTIKKKKRKISITD